MMNNLLKLRQIPGFSDYFISMSGSVLSIKRSRSRFMRRVRQKNGYDTVMLFRNNRGQMLGIHRIVLMSWMGSPKQGQESRHLNGIRHDNRLSNLCWGTRVENFQDRDAHGTTAWGERNGYSKLTVDDVVAIRNLAARGTPHGEIALRFDIYQSTISDIVSGETWRRAPGPIKHGGYFKRAKLTEATVIEMRQRHAAGASRMELAHAFGVSGPTISNVVNRDTWRHLP